MHEFSMTNQIINQILEEARKHNTKQVKEVHLIIGKLTFLSPAQIRFAYRVLVKNTIMENSQLHIEEKDGVIKCDNCGYIGDIRYEDDPLYHIPYPILSCPKCEGIADIVAGKECRIKSIKVVA